MLLAHPVRGWLTVIGWIAGLTAAAFFVAELVLSLIALNNASFESTRWQGTLLLWAILLVCVVINIFISGALPAIEVIVLIIHILGFFGLLVPLVYLTPAHNSAREVFTTFNNGGNWSSQALAFFIGLQGNALAFVGTDSAVHVRAREAHERARLRLADVRGSQECQHRRGSIYGAQHRHQRRPRLRHALRRAVQRHGHCGRHGELVGLPLHPDFCRRRGLQCRRHHHDKHHRRAGVLQCSGQLGRCFSHDVVFRSRPRPALLALPEHGMCAHPAHAHPRAEELQIDKRTTIPVVAILLVAILSALLALINIGSYTAFNDITSLVLEGFYISYLMAVGLLLWRRMRGDIRSPDNTTLTSFGSASNAPSESISCTNLTWGPWRVKGVWGVVNNAVACSYLVVLIFFSFWPNTVPVTPANMNFAVLIIGSIILFSIAYYLIWAKRSYTGPIVEVDLHTL